MSHFIMAEKKQKQKQTSKQQKEISDKSDQVSFKVGLIFESK